MKKNKIIYSLGIYKGGGLTILKTLLKNNKFFFYLDSRLESSHYLNLKKKYYIVQKNNLYNLIKNCINFLKLPENRTIYFMSSSLPIFRLKCFSYGIYQNANIFFNLTKSDIIRWFFSVDFLRYINFTIFKKNINEWLVFNHIAKLQIENKISKFCPVKILNISLIKNTFYRRKKKKDFIYPADLMRHKNHKNLLEAFIILAKKKITPSLTLTLNKYELKKINYISLKKKININNFYSEDTKEYNNYLASCKYLIYPSLNETLGLPLLEANNFGLKIICSKTDFASQYDFIDDFFNPLSPDDIANCIIRLLKNKQSKFKKNELDYPSFAEYIE